MNDKRLINRARLARLWLRSGVDLRKTQIDWGVKATKIALEWMKAEQEHERDEQRPTHEDARD